MERIPDGADIANALEDLAAGLRINPEGLDDHCWLCVLHGPDGAQNCGIGLTAREAAADAWVSSWELPQLLDCIMGKAAPAEPDGRWRFELAAPGCWERVHATVAPRVIGRG
jgi:hypothetical protein